MWRPSGCLQQSFRLYTATYATCFGLPRSRVKLGLDPVERQMFRTPPSSLLPSTQLEAGKGPAIELSVAVAESFRSEGSGGADGGGGETVANSTGSHCDWPATK